jgi:hypothetical protein
MMSSRCESGFSGCDGRLAGPLQAVSCTIQTDGSSRTSCVLFFEFLWVSFDYTAVIVRSAYAVAMYCSSFGNAHLRPRDVLRVPAPGSFAAVARHSWSSNLVLYVHVRLASQTVFIHPYRHTIDSSLSRPSLSLRRATEPSSRRHVNCSGLVGQRAPPRKPTVPRRPRRHGPSQVKSRSGPCLCWGIPLTVF